MSVIPAIPLLAVAALMYAPSPRTEGPINSVRTFVIYEPVYTQADADLLARFRPDFVCRGWFKWSTSQDWAALAPFAESCRKRGIRLQGGITVAALYPHENGITDEQFRDFATTDVEGRPYRVGGPNGWYHLSLYNPKVTAYLKADVRRQIDAGAAGIWYDEIEGYYDWNPTEGYDTYACAAFRDWLIAKYCGRLGWKQDDPRWRTVFGIDLAKYGGTIHRFDYRDYLLTTPGKDGKPLAADPPQGDPRRWADSPNPLYREWGFAWDRLAKGTFRFDTVARIFADLVADANRYAREKYGRTLINTYNHNGTARPGVQFLQPHLGPPWPMPSGRLDARRSHLPDFEKVVRDAAKVDPGVPVVFFVDWPGEADRMAAMDRQDQLTFFGTYIPEAYAAGGEFALPVRGYTYVSREQGTIGYLARLCAFYREQFTWFRGSRPVTGPVEAPEEIAARVRRAAPGTVVHLINHRAPEEPWKLEPLRGVSVTVPWSGPDPVSAWEVSPDLLGRIPVRFVRRGSSLVLTLPVLRRSALILLPNRGAKVRFEAAAPEHAAGGTMARGVLYDRFGIPMRGTRLVSDGRIYDTDDWGRFQIPAKPDSAARALRADGSPFKIPLRPGFTAWQRVETSRVVGRFVSNAAGFWPNWERKGETPEAARVKHEAHLGAAALRCDFLPVSSAWRNVNSPGVDTRGMDTVEIVYAGDGSGRAVSATLQALGGTGGDRFYTVPLPLKPTSWTTLRIPLSDFRDSTGARFSAEQPGRAAFQLSVGGDWTGFASVWLRSVRLLRDGPPVRELWHVDTSHAIDPELDRP